MAKSGHGGNSRHSAAHLTKPSARYDRVVDICEELVKFILLTRDSSACLTDRYNGWKSMWPNLKSGSTSSWS